MRILINPLIYKMFRMLPRSFFLTLLCTVCSVFIVLSFITVSGQPTWSFKIRIMYDEYYMGEWGKIWVNITNVDCNIREDAPPLIFKDLNEKIFKTYLERAEKMRSENFIENYFYTVENLRGVGTGEIYGDYTLKLTKVCKGRSILVLSVGLWFPWTDIGKSSERWRTVNTRLEAFNPVKFILHGRDTGSSILVGIDFFFPEDIKSEEIKLQPIVDVRVHFPDWIPYTLENLNYSGKIVVLPYRSFNLTVTDFDCVHVLSGAKLVLRRLIHYYDVREYIVPADGRVKIWRLLDDKYEVAVYWNSTRYAQMYPFIYFEQHWAYDLAHSKIIKTRLYNLKLNILDLKNSRLSNAKTYLDGYEMLAVNGLSMYSLVPEGNHSIQVFWRNVKVYDGWVWAGYHPTIYPWMTRPAIEHNITTSVGDLVVQVVDTGGNRIGANFTVIGLNPETSIKNFYSRNGLLNFSQVPLGEYVVRAVNVSRIFGNIVEGSITVIPGAGKISYLNLPIHSVKFHVLGMNDKPLKNAEIVFGPISTRLDDNGDVLFTGVPRGIYKFTVFWRGLKIYEKDVNIDGTLSEVVRVPVYDIHIVFLDHLGRRFYCNYSLKAPGGLSISSDKPKHEVYVEMVPEGTVNIVLYSPEGRLLLNESRLVSELAKISELKLPVSDMIVRIYFGNESLEKAEVRVKDVVYGGEYVEFTDRDGCAVFENMVFSNYSIRVNYPQTQMALKIFYHYFNGSIIDVNVEKAGLIVKVMYEDDTPIVGIEVTLFYGLTYLDRVVTDLNGYAYFKDIPKLPSYRVVVNHGGKEYSQTAIPNSTVMVKIEKPLLSRETIGMLIQISIISGISIAVAILIYKLVRYIGRVLETVPPRTPSRIHFS